MMTMVVLFLAAMFLQATQPTAPQTKANGSIQGLVIRAGTSEPLARARLTLTSISAPAVAGQRRPSKNFTTDASGRFTFTDLEPGRYNLSVQSNGYVRTSFGQRAPNRPGAPLVLEPGQAMKDVVFQMVPAGVVTGRIYDWENQPLSSAEVALLRATYDQNGQRTLTVTQTTFSNDLGEYRLYWVTPGKYYLRANWTGAMNPMARNPNEMVLELDEAFAPSFYPGTSDETSAGIIDVLPGAQISAMDLTITRSRGFKVRGRVIVASSSDAGRNRPSISIRQRQFSGFTTSTGSSTTYNPDGTFELRNVRPGSYYVMAMMGSPASGMLFSQAAVDVGEADVDGVVLTLSDGFPLRGKIYVEGQTAPAPVSVNPLESVRPLLTPRGDTIFMGMTRPEVSSDGSFVINQVLPGSYSVTLTGLPPDYYVKAVRFEDADVQREGLTLNGPTEASLDILMSPNAGTIEGAVLNADGPVAGVQVVMIPRDRTRSERYKFANTDQNGRFTIRGIAPDQYKLFAWEEIEMNAFRDPEFLRLYEELGKAVGVVEGDRQTVEVRLIPAGNND